MLPSCSALTNTEKHARERVRAGGEGRGNRDTTRGDLGRWLGVPHRPSQPSTATLDGPAWDDPRFCSVWNPTTTQAAETLGIWV